MNQTVNLSNSGFRDIEYDQVFKNKRGIEVFEWDHLNTVTGTEVQYPMNQIGWVLYYPWICNKPNFS